MANQQTAQEWQQVADQLNQQIDQIQGQQDQLDQQYADTVKQLGALRAQKSAIIAANGDRPGGTGYAEVTAQINAIYTAQDQITNQKNQLAAQSVDIQQQVNKAERQVSLAGTGPSTTNATTPPGGASPAGTSANPTSVPPITNTVVPAVSAANVAAPASTPTAESQTPAETAATPVDPATDPNTNLGAEAQEDPQPTEQAVIDAEQDPFERARIEAAQRTTDEQPTEDAVDVGEEDPFEARRLELEQEQNRQQLTEEATDVEPGPGIGQVARDAGPSFGENPDAADEAASAAQAGRINAQRQQTLQARQNRNSQGDWRVRIHLAPGSNYLYNAPAGTVGGRQLPGPGILAPLTVTDGVIFPYTPVIETSYQAKYQTSDLVHSNYRGYFYQGSQVENVTIRGTFTAQDTAEAQYLLAAIHFFRSVTKMFYGKDQQAGTPPPLVYISGLGQYQFNKHPCVVSNFQYSLPNDVDYIRADGFNNYGLNLENRRSLSSGPSLGGALGFLANKLGVNGLLPGGLKQVPAQGAVTSSISNTTNKDSTYVPTKMEISVTLLPIQTRSQVSQQFSLEAFANGNLLKGGFW